MFGCIDGVKYSSMCVCVCLCLRWQVIEGGKRAERTVKKGRQKPEKKPMNCIVYVCITNQVIATQ